MQALAFNNSHKLGLNWSKFMNIVEGLVSLGIFAKYKYTHNWSIICNLTQRLHIVKDMRYKMCSKKLRNLYVSVLEL